MHLLLFSRSVYVQLFATPWTAIWQAPLSFWSLLKFMSIELVMLSNHLILCCSLLLLPSIFPSIRVFSKESALRLSGQSIGVLALKAVLPLSIQGWFPLGLTGLISVPSEGLSKSLLQQHSLKASILHPSAFFMVQFSHPYVSWLPCIPVWHGS